MPELNMFYEKYAKNSAVVFVSITFESRKKVKSFSISLKSFSPPFCHAFTLPLSLTQKVKHESDKRNV